MTSCSTNRFVISKSKIQGYLAIYFMLISNQSNFSEIYMTPYRTVIMAGLLCVFLFTAKKGKNILYLVFCIFNHVCLTNTIECGWNRDTHNCAISS